MGRTVYFVVALALIALVASLSNGEEMDYRELTRKEENVIVNGGTEPPFTGVYVDSFENGVYTCRRCGAVLFHSESKFRAQCGWPAFDSAVEGAVETRPDSDGSRTEILCKACGAHLGHVFTGENYTETNTRHCVNSISMDFIPEERIKTAYFAGGCFWGIEHTFSQIPGVLQARSGYMGGNTSEPSYEQVCNGTTGHTETVMVTYDSTTVTFRELAVTFFEIHDPEQVNRQGYDTGTQYRSAVFYTSELQLEVLGELVQLLENKGYQIATEVLPAEEFWSAEEYHQNYFETNGVRGSCHSRVRRFQ